MIHTDHNKPSLLVLYYGEYRTFEECLSSHKFLNSEDFDIEVVYSTWNKSIALDHKKRRSHKPELMDVNEDRVINAFSQNSLSLPITVNIHKYDMQIDMGTIPILASWKLAYDYLKTVVHKYDYVFLLRGDLIFKDITLKKLSDNQVIVHPLTLEDTATNCTDEVIHDLYYFCKSTTMIHILESVLSHHRFDSCQEKPLEMDGRYWHNYLAEAFPKNLSEYYFDEVDSINCISIKRFP